MNYAEYADRVAVNVEIVGNKVPVTTPRDYTLALVEDIARKHGVDVKDVRGASRHRPVVLARCEAIRAVSKARPTWSYPVLGRFFGNRDHTTIMYHLDKSGQGRHVCRCDWHIEHYSREYVDEPKEGFARNLPDDSR